MSKSKPRRIDNQIEAEGLIDGLNILRNLKLASFDHFATQERTRCSKCGQRRRYYCFTCYEVMGEQSAVPHFDLPVHLDIVFYPTENEGKATSIHARVLCGEKNVSIHKFPNVPKFDVNTDVVLFPTQDAVLLDSFTEEQLKAIKHVIVLDAQWHSVSRMDRHENLAGLRRVKIRTYSTTFWRYQNLGQHCLATIEAIYYFYREYGNASGGYNGEYDNLLYYYWFFYNMIQHQYSGGKRKYIDRHVAGYIKDDQPNPMEHIFAEIDRRNQLEKNSNKKNDDDNDNRTSNASTSSTTAATTSKLNNNSNKNDNDVDVDDDDEKVKNISNVNDGDDDDDDINDKTADSNERKKSKIS